MTISAVHLVCNQRASQQNGRYPRPSLVRGSYVDLDRWVGFAFDDELVGLKKGWQRCADPFHQKILLPFPPESKKSGVGDPQPHSCFWYRIELSDDDLERAGRCPGHRLLMHFGAVDYQAMVFVDGTLAGTHEGGQVPFYVDITDYLDPAIDDHVVVVRAFDDSRDTRQPRGKQDWHDDPHVIWYHRTSGIWRSVWLEWVPSIRIERLVWRAEPRSSGVMAHVELNQRPEAPIPVDVAVAIDEKLLGQVSTVATDQIIDILIPLNSMRNSCDLENMTWAPDHPVLMDAALVIGDDTVTSYMGYREVDVSPAGIILNNLPFIVRSVLEQGYWPQSHLTPPSVEAMAREVTLMKELGFNNCRIHQKVEDPRFLFQCDKQGLTVWGETAAAYNFDSLAIHRFSAEWIEIVRAYESHPCIIAWTPFNESWGIPQIGQDACQAAFSQGIVKLTRALDPTRPVISNDGWEHTDSDLMTIHDYECHREILEARYQPDGIDDFMKTRGPAGRVMTVGKQQNHNAPIIISECGGIRYVSNSQDMDTWGYSTAGSTEDFENKLADIIEPLRAARLVRGFCWTQLTDTLQEANGLCDENRVPKIPVERIRKLITGSDEEA
ncbi:glycoside hydrolase family 2 TIM barrel-domain containing protein [uncultured Cutibacterium sp.]|jgi:putative glycoside hydrolase family 2 (glycosyl hydrolase family 2)|uniref:glycoside hydrolase family 2 protein n=1 Tax=uncultured Cutibacterium sp. TaxID=1912223 RepID=UPI002805D4DD|nr:glycoside hydrolase family 2 TIM barrel-domain containing protein [uncultured Cutibacterium sp.]MDU1580460.1 glycoside hydrolase family 2 TIM barrel-domain containing protein [Cutibacterium granulosum]